MGNLPIYRSDFRHRLWSKIALDLSGPHRTKSRIRSREATKLKSYGLIIRDLCLGCIYISIMQDLSLDSFIMSMEEFMFTHGKVTYVYTDLGSQIVAAAKETEPGEQSQIWDLNDPKIKTYFTSKGILWEYAPVSAANFNGLAESGVKLLKCHLKRSLEQGARLTDIELRMLFVKLTYLINQRPVSGCRSMNPIDEEKPFLTANDLLFMSDQLPEDFMKKKIKLFADMKLSKTISQHFGKVGQQTQVYMLH